MMQNHVTCIRNQAVESRDSLSMKDQAFEAWNPLLLKVSLGIVTDSRMQVFVAQGECRSSMAEILHPE